jgi:hypothetical protein
MGWSEFFTLPSDQIDSAWGWIRRFLDRVPSYDWTPEDVRHDLITAQAQLWCLSGGDSLVTGIVITRIENYHSTRYGLLWIAAGKGIEDGVAVLEPIEQWFKKMGCQFVQITGRKGWGRALPDYQERARVYVKEL